jgi:hypothetical protein
VTVRQMSDGELTRLEVLRNFDQRRLTTEAAAGQLLRLERRQVLRLLKAYGTEGLTGLIPKRRGRPSNRRKPEERPLPISMPPAPISKPAASPSPSTATSMGCFASIRPVLSAVTG